MFKSGREGYDQIIGLGAKSLAPGEFWYIEHPDGPLYETASADLSHPVRAICDALDCNWDELTEQGYRLTRGVVART